MQAPGEFSLRSLLFVPADSGRKIEKALATDDEVAWLDDKMIDRAHLRLAERRFGQVAHSLSETINAH